MVKKTFDTPLHNNDKSAAHAIVDDASAHDVTTIINVGTSLVESKNCVLLAQWFEHMHAVVGIHPNDVASSWQQDLRELASMCRKQDELKIVGIGECGLDFHYPDYNITRQKDAFKAQIELALKQDLALVIHTRDAADETLRVIEGYKDDIKRGIIHCFSENISFAQQVIAWNFMLGLGGTITYPKNNYLREVAQEVSLEHIVLETDAPYLPPQIMRGKQNSPSSIQLIAQYLAQLRGISFEKVAAQTTVNARRVFDLL